MTKSSANQQSQDVTCCDIFYPSVKRLAPAEFLLLGSLSCACLTEQFLLQLTLMKDAHCRLQWLPAMKKEALVLVDCHTLGTRRERPCMVFGFSCVLCQMDALFLLGSLNTLGSCS